MKYKKLDNYDAIHVEAIKDIPCDYEGVMAVPISILEVYNPKQFEIIGCTANFSNVLWGINCKKYENLKQHRGSTSAKCMRQLKGGGALVYKERPVGVYYTADNVNGYIKETYRRVLIRHRNPKR